MGFLVMSTGEPMQVNTSALSEIKVVREIDFPKRYKPARSDGLPPSFFKEGGDLLT